MDLGFLVGGRWEMAASESLDVKISFLFGLRAGTLLFFFIDSFWVAANSSPISFLIDRNLVGEMFRSYPLGFKERILGAFKALNLCIVTGSLRRTRASLKNQLRSKANSGDYFYEVIISFKVWNRITTRLTFRRMAMTVITKNFFAVKASKKPTLAN